MKKNFLGAVSRQISLENAGNINVKDDISGKGIQGEKRRMLVGEEARGVQVELALGNSRPISFDTSNCAEPLKLKKKPPRKLTE